MKMDFVIFFSIFFSVYGVVNFYIGKRGWDVFPAGSTARYYYLVAFLIVSLSFIGARFLERAFLCPFTSTLVWIGSFWIAAMVYFFFSLLLIDIIRIFNYFFSFLPAVWFQNIQKTKQTLAGILIILVSIIISIGYIQCFFPAIRHISITIHKKAKNFKNLTIALATDIHLGTVINNGRMERIVERINALKPDIVLLAGDIMDEDVGSAFQKDFGRAMSQLKAPLGVYAVTGNHEYISGVEAACQYLTANHVRVLRDETVKIADSFYLVGREDRVKPRFTGERRQSVAELLTHVDKSLPIIMMDHQPIRLSEAQENGVDLQVSGHTHYGQLWPFNFIIQRIYEVPWGYRQKGDTHIYVSSGAATWGPPVRTVNRAEIVEIRVQFD